MTELSDRILVDSELVGYLRYLIDNDGGLEKLPVDMCAIRADELAAGYESPVDEEDETEIESEGIQRVVTGPIVRDSKWKPTAFVERNPFDNFTIIDEHPTGHVDENWHENTPKDIEKTKIGDRVEFESIDGYPTFSNTVKKGGIVNPLGIDSPYIELDYSTVSAIRLMYHHRRDAYSGLPGKDISLLPGCGWIGRAGYARKPGGIWGSDGAVANVMHHVTRGSKNGHRLLVSTEKTTSLTRYDKGFYGTLVGGGENTSPLNKYNAIVVTMDRHEGYSLHVNGVLQSKLKCKPIKNWEACMGVNYRIRCMHGGKPEELLSLRDYTERFGGFYLGVK